MHVFPRKFQNSWSSEYDRSSPPELFSGKGVMEISSKFTGEHPCWSVISIKLLFNFIEITLRHGCSRINWLHIFRTPFLKNTYGRTFKVPVKACFWNTMHQNFSMMGKTHNMILSQAFHAWCAAGNSIFRASNNKTRLI